MKILNIILMVLLVVLSMAAGAAKVMGVPQEVQFLQGFGFSASLIMVYGVIQIAGGVLFAVPKTFNLGAWITILAFALSSVLIFISGNFIFAFASLLPIVLTVYVVWQSIRLKHREN